MRYSVLMCLLLPVAMLASCASAPEAEKLATESREAASYTKGVPGGAKERVTRLVATVKEVDYKNRRVTLQDEAGNIKTFPVPQEAINFEQVEKGDRVTVAVVEALVISLVDKNTKAENGAAQLAGRAPAGNKPQAVMAEGRDVTAVVTAVDLQKHTATLKFPDGMIQTVQVRDDVELKKSYVGREVLFQYREAAAISVDKME